MYSVGSRLVEADILFNKELKKDHTQFFGSIILIIFNLYN